MLVNDGERGRIIVWRTPSPPKQPYAPPAHKAVLHREAGDIEPPIFRAPRICLRQSEERKESARYASALGLNPSPSASFTKREIPEKPRPRPATRPLAGASPRTTATIAGRGARSGDESAAIEIYDRSGGKADGHE